MTGREIGGGLFGESVAVRGGVELGRGGSAKTGEFDVEGKESAPVEGFFEEGQDSMEVLSCHFHFLFW